MKAKNLILDGEITALDEQGDLRSSFFNLTGSVTIFSSHSTPCGPTNDLLQSYDFEKAAEFFKHVTKIFLDSFEAWYSLATAYEVAPRESPRYQE